MMTGDKVGFGPFRLDFRQRELSRDGKPVRLGGRALDILCALAAAKGDVVTKDALMTAVWSGQIVEENAIQVQISALRKALDEDKSGADFIVTVPGRGYRLTGLADGEAGAARGPTESRPIAVCRFRT
jgi:DNA-binding winged helix-turn-helix (wHTH) protein